MRKALDVILPFAAGAYGMWGIADIAVFHRPILGLFELGFSIYVGVHWAVKRGYRRRLEAKAAAWTEFADQPR